MEVRRWIAIGGAALAVALPLGGCDGGADHARSAYQATAPAATAPSERLAALEAENRQLRERTAELEEELGQVTAAPAAGSEAAWLDGHPELSVFATAHEWTSATVESLADQGATGKTSVPGDPALLNALSGLFVIQGTADDPNGPHGDVDPFAVTLGDGSMTYRVNVVARDAVEFPDIAPGVWFRVPPQASNFGKAWMRKPDYVPDASMESRLLDSGMLRVREGGNGDAYATADGFRIRGLAIGFLQAKPKKLDAASAGKPDGDPLLEATFYRYGNAIVMTVYPKRVRLQVGESDAWYAIGEETAERMRSFLAAG